MVEPACKRPRAGDPDKSAQKVRFIRESMSSNYPFEKEVELCDDLVKAMEWQAARSPEQV